MSFHARPISFKPPRLKGLSPRLIASHYENNYGGAVLLDGLYDSFAIKQDGGR